MHINVFYNGCVIVYFFSDAVLFVGIDLFLFSCRHELIKESFVNFNDSFNQLGDLKYHSVKLASRLRQRLFNCVRSVDFNCVSEIGPQ